MINNDFIIINNIFQNYLDNEQFNNNSKYTNYIVGIKFINFINNKIDNIDQKNDLNIIIKKIFIKYNQISILSFLNNFLFDLNKKIFGNFIKENNDINIYDEKKINIYFFHQYIFDENNKNNKNNDINVYNNIKNLKITDNIFDLINEINKIKEINKNVIFIEYCLKLFLLFNYKKSKYYINILNKDLNDDNILNNPLIYNIINSNLINDIKYDDLINDIKLNQILNQIPQTLFNKIKNIKPLNKSK